MGAQGQNLIGARSGTLVIVARADVPTGKRRARYWSAKCDACGSLKVVSQSAWHRGFRSCGCLNPQRRGSALIAHKGVKKRPEYQVWVSMIVRCTRLDHVSFKNYGAKGVKVCERWLNSFEAFFADVGPRPVNASLDRFPNAEGHYEPNNVRWATREEQRRNQKRIKLSPEKIQQIKSALLEREADTDLGSDGRHFGSNTLEKIATRFGVSRETIYAIRKGHIWKEFTKEFTNAGS